MSQWIDRIGGVASAACAAHCLTLAFAPAVLPILGLGFLVSESAEWAFVASAAFIALVAAGIGHRLHRSWKVTAGFGFGVIALIAGRFGEVLDLHGAGLALALLGGAVLVCSHFMSLRLRRACLEATCSTG